MILVTLTGLSLGLLEAGVAQERVLSQSQISLADALASVTYSQIVGDGRLPVSSARVEVDGELVYAVFGRCTAAFWKHSGQLRAYRVDLTGVEGAGGWASIEDSKEIAEAFIHVMGAPSADWAYERTSSDEATDALRFTAIIADRRAELTVTVVVDKLRMTAASLSIAGWHDYARFARSGVINRESAINRGLDAYYRFSPFEGARLVGTELVLGLPRLGPTGRSAVNWLPEHEQLRQASVAIPLYRLSVEEASGFIRQWIEVDGRTGRVLGIALSGRADVAAAELGPLPQSFMARLGDESQRAALSSTGVSQETTPKGHPVCVRVDNRLLRGIAISDFSGVWLKEAHLWRRFDTDRDGARVLQEAHKRQSQDFTLR